MSKIKKEALKNLQIDNFDYIMNLLKPFKQLLLRMKRLVYLKG